jgi:putative peptidoglycan lipid II flippase
MGLGLAFAIAYLVSAVWAIRVLARKVREFPLRPVFTSLGRMLLAAVLMAEIVWIVTRHVGSDSGWGAVTRLVVGGLLGLGVYGGLLLALRAPELDQLRSRLARRASV